MLTLKSTVSKFTNLYHFNPFIFTGGWRLANHSDSFKESYNIAPFTEHSLVPSSSTQSERQRPYTVPGGSYFWFLYWLLTPWAFSFFSNTWGTLSTWDLTILPLTKVLLLLFLQVCTQKVLFPLAFPDHPDHNCDTLSFTLIPFLSLLSVPQHHLTYLVCSHIIVLSTCIVDRSIRVQ